MANKWIMHVKKTMKQMKSKGTYAKGKGLGQVIQEAKKTWKKGGAAHTPAPVTGGMGHTAGSMKKGAKTRKNGRHGRK